MKHTLGIEYLKTSQSVYSTSYGLCQTTKLAFTMARLQIKMPIGRQQKKLRSIQY